MSDLEKCKHGERIIDCCVCYMESRLIEAGSIIRMLERQLAESQARVKDLEADAKTDKTCQETITEELGKEIKRLRDALELLAPESQIACEALRKVSIERDAI